MCTYIRPWKETLPHLTHSLWWHGSGDLYESELNLWLHAPFLPVKTYQKKSYVSTFCCLHSTHIHFHICTCTSPQWWHKRAGSHVPGCMYLNLGEKTSPWLNLHKSEQYTAACWSKNWKKLWKREILVLTWAGFVIWIQNISHLTFAGVIVVTVYTNMLTIMPRTAWIRTWKETTR